MAKILSPDVLHKTDAGGVVLTNVAADNAGSTRVLLRNGFTRVGEETGYARARAAEITEHIYRLDEAALAG